MALGLHKLEELTTRRLATKWLDARKRTGADRLRDVLLQDRDLHGMRNQAVPDAPDVAPQAEATQAERRLREILRRDRTLVRAHPEDALDLQPLPVLATPDELPRAEAPADAQDEPSPSSVPQGVWASTEATASDSPPPQGVWSSPEPPPRSAATSRAKPAEPTRTEPARAEPARAEPADPIRTHTMARLLASQGYRKRALSIYYELLAHDPTNATLQAEVDAIRTAGVA